MNPQKPTKTCIISQGSFSPSPLPYQNPNLQQQACPLYDKLCQQHPPLSRLTKYPEQPTQSGSPLKSPIFPPFPQPVNLPAVLPVPKQPHEIPNTQDILEDHIQQSPKNIVHTESRFQSLKHQMFDEKYQREGGSIIDIEEQVDRVGEQERGKEHVHRKRVIEKRRKKDRRD